jgi:hypothetical protein
MEIDNRVSLVNSKVPSALPDSQFFVAEDSPAGRHGLPSRLAFWHDGGG